MVFLNKKADAVAAIVIVIIIVVFLGWLINVGHRECNSNNDCGEGYYCSVEHNCHKIPVLEGVVVKHNYVWPSIIIGLAIIVAAIILKYKRNGKKEESEENKAAEELETTYY